MTALAVWLGALWIGWKIEDAAERIVSAIGEWESKE